MIWVDGVHEVERGGCVGADIYSSTLLDCSAGSLSGWSKVTFDRSTSWVVLGFEVKQTVVEGWAVAIPGKSHQATRSPMLPWRIFNFIPLPPTPYVITDRVLHGPSAMSRCFKP